MCLQVKLTAKIFLLVYLVLPVKSSILRENIPELGRMNFMEICEYLCLTCEQHQVITEDGYILTVHHVVGDKTKPLLLWHGLIDSSDTFIIRAENSTIASLSEEGYDIWVGNSRGNKYSRSHVSLDPDKDKKKFWDFSFHEMGYYDVASTIDFVLARTGQDKLSAIGVSQGTTIFYVLASMRSCYNDKIKFFISMAPIAYLEHLEGLAEDLMPEWVLTSKLLSLAGVYEVFKADSQFIQKTCTLKILGDMLCNEVVAMGLTGTGTDGLEPEFFKVLIGHFPAGSSKKSVDHFVQLYYSKRFAEYDYGCSRNLEIYGTHSPPDYPLVNVSMPVALLRGTKDSLSTEEDVQRLRSELSNVVYYTALDLNHLGFQFAQNVDTYVNPLLKELLNIYG